MEIPALNGKKKFINDTLLRPSLKKNILYVGQMMQQNYKLVFDNKEFLIMNKFKKIFNCGEKRNDCGQDFQTHFCLK